MTTPLEMTTKHADALDKVADGMQAAGIGLHPTLGHVALLRRMAGAMRADAAGGKVPHEFSDRASMYAGAIQPLPGAVIRTLSAAKLPTDRAIPVSEFDDAVRAAGLDISDRLIAKRTLERAGRLT